MGIWLVTFSSHRPFFVFSYTLTTFTSFLFWFFALDVLFFSSRLSDLVISFASLYLSLKTFWNISHKSFFSSSFLSPSSKDVFRSLSSLGLVSVPSFTVTESLFSLALAVSFVVVSLFFCIEKSFSIVLVLFSLVKNLSEKWTFRRSFYATHICLVLSTWPLVSSWEIGNTYIKIDVALCPSFLFFR